MKIRLFYLAPLIALFAVLLTEITLFSSPVSAQSRENSANAICGPANYDERNPNADPNGAEPTEEEYKAKRDACIKGFNAALKNNATAPRNQAPYGPCYTDADLYKDNSSLAPSCHTGYARAYADRERIKEQPEREPEPTEEERLEGEGYAACDEITPGANNEDALNRACSDGYAAAKQGKSKGAACQGSGINNQYCLKGYDLASATNPESDQDTEPACETKFTNPLTWAVCPAVAGINEAVQQLDNVINDLLHIDTGRAFGTESDPSKFKDAWESFRVIALGFIFIAALIVIISSALGFEILDAYTIRKTLPRLIIAVIFITLSWSILSFLVQLTNDVGDGIRALIYAPFSGQQAELSALSGSIATLLTGVAFLAFGIMGLLSFGVTALLAALIAFLILVLREIIVIFLVIVAPIAIAAMILPNTRKAWDFWRSTLITMLLVFPIIAGMIAMGRVFSVITFDANSDNVVNNIIAFIAYYLPYFLLPFAFRLAGGVIGTLAGIGNDRSRGAFDRLKNYRGNKAQQNWGKLKAGSRFNEDHVAAPLTRRFNNFSRGATNLGAAGFNPRRMRSRMQAALSTHALDEAKESMEKNSHLRAIIGNDDYNNAVEHSLKRYGNVTDRGIREYLANEERDPRTGERLYGKHNYTGRGLEQGVAAVREARRSMSAESFAIATTVANAGTGTGYGNGEAEMLQAINRVAGGDRHLANRMLADARGAAERANRVDLAGPGFGGQSGRLERLFTDDTFTVAESNQQAAEAALEVKGAGTIMTARGNAVRNLAPQMLRQLQHTVDEAHAGRLSQRDIDQELAAIAGRYDAMAQSAPENAKIVANEVLGRTILDPSNGQRINVRQAIEARRSNPAFLEMRREYQTQAQYHQAAAAATQGQPPPSQPTPQGGP